MQQRRLGLALGGGGFRGSAHLGVLYELERLDVTIDVVSGTSVGAVIGAALAAGYRANEIERAFQGLAPHSLISRDRERRGLISADRLKFLLDDLFGDKLIEELRLPFGAVTVDVATGNEVILDRGPLVEALLATTAIPGVFPPRQIGGASLVDGGIRNNLPINVAYGLGAERVIAINLIGNESFNIDQEPPAGLFAWQRWLPLRQFALAERAILLMLHYLTQHNLHQMPPDLLLTPLVNELSIWAFLSADAGLAAGKKAALDQREAIEDLRRWRLGEETRN